MWNERQDFELFDGESHNAFDRKVAGWDMQGREAIFKERMVVVDYGGSDVQMRIGSLCFDAWIPVEADDLLPSVVQERIYVAVESCAEPLEPGEALVDAV